MKKRITMSLLSMSMLASCTATPALAYTDENSNAGDTIVIGVDTETNETTDDVTATDTTTSETDATDAATDTSEDSSESDEPVIDRTDAEPAEPLTPDGNMTLVDDVTVTSGTKQFLTLTTRDGNFYYLIIDRDKDGNENVHFLNQVDERDLIGLMDEDEARELEEHLAEQEAEREVGNTLTGPTMEEPTETPEPTPEPEKVINIGGFEISQKAVTAGIGLVLIIIILIIALTIFKKKKRPEANRPDPDAGYDDDLGDEIEIEQGSFDENDFDE